jgi:hypothetical protein
MTCILIDEMFYAMHFLTIIITCTFLAELEVHKRKFGSYMRNRVMDDDQGSYIHEEEIIIMHFDMGNDETKSNGRRDRQEPITMRSLHREVKRYRDDNEMIMKDKEDIIHNLNMLHNHINKESGTKQSTSSR